MQHDEIESLLNEILIDHRKKINDDKRYLGLLSEENDEVAVISNGIDKTSPAYSILKVIDDVDNNQSNTLSNDFNKLNLNSEKITRTPITSQPHIGIGEHEAKLIQDGVTESQLSLPISDYNSYKSCLKTNETQTETLVRNETVCSAVQTDLQNILIDLVQVSSQSKSPPKTPTYNRTKLMNDIRPIFTSSSNQSNLLVHLGDLRKKIKKT